MGERRTRVDIIGDLLEAVRAREGRIKPTHLMYKANLSHKSLKEYLDELKQKGLLTEETDKDKRVIVITKKGTDFLDQFRKMKAFQDTFGI